MSIETKEEFLERLLAQEKPKCPHCAKEMSIWEVPPFTFSDGLGWGAPYVYVCFSDTCPVYVQGWEEMEDRYGHRTSCRCLRYPFDDNFELMPVFGETGGTQGVITEEVMDEQKRLEESIKTGFATLADCYVNKDFLKMLSMLSDHQEPLRVRIKAAEMLGDICDTEEVVEPMRNITAHNQKMKEAMEEGINKILKRCFVRECPFCMEIIKRRANVCKHCGKDVDPVI